MNLKKYLLTLSIISIPFLTSGCIVQDKITELKMNKMEKLISTANEKQAFHEDMNNNPTYCVEGCDNEHFVPSESYYQEQGINSILYKFMNDNYNQIIVFKDKNTGADTYAFRYATDLILGNGSGTYFVYEIGRILINSQNPKKSKCTYNYMAGYDKNPVQWVDCSETNFIKTLPEIAKLKKTEFEKFRKLNKLAVQRELCAYAESRNSVECQNPKLETAYEKENEQLAILRKTTL